MGRTVSYLPGYALDDDDEFDPQLDDFISKNRSYLHFDLPLSECERASFVASNSDICASARWPLVGYITKERRIKKQPDRSLKFQVKERPIKFASHRDAALLEFYACDLMKSYESYISNTALSTVVLAYRSNIGNNILHSKSLFDEIRARGDCTAIAVDITSFFDKINHLHLYQALVRVRGKSRLNSADFKIFQRMTKFDWVDSDAARDRLTFRYGRKNRICNGPEFRRLLREQKPSIINTNDKPFGIPQGTPLSGLYANISLLNFDEKMSAAAVAMGGSYRRYSDDIALVIPTSAGPVIALEEIRNQLGSIGLELSEGKTKISIFNRTDNRIRATEPFQYLGFTFDGERTFVRQSSLNRYYSKMNRGIRAKVHAAKKNGVVPDRMFLRELYRKYTHFGQYRNFPRYVYRASVVHAAPEMKAQLSRHMAVFKKMLSSAVADIY